MTRREWADLSDFFAAGVGPRAFAFGFPGTQRHARRGGRWFESGEMRLVILRLVKDKPRHGYEIIKALEDRTGGCYTPSAGTVYPTLQLLEDQGYVRIVEEGGKKVYHITPEGERYLDEHQDALSGIGERIREAMRGVAGGAIGDVNSAFADLAKRTFKEAWRSGPESEKTKKIAEILRRTLSEIEAL